MATHSALGNWLGRALVSAGAAGLALACFAPAAYGEELVSELNAPEIPVSTGTVISKTCAIVIVAPKAYLNNPKYASDLAKTKKYARQKGCTYSVEQGGKPGEVVTTYTIELVIG
jgi:hypothetical protein